MHEKLIREINGEIADALLARKMPFAPSRKAALALLKVPGWTEGLEQMLPIRGRLECAHVLELCSCVLPRLAPRPEEGWLAFCTQYARERMYPGQGFAPDREEYEAGALFFLTVLQVMLDRERRAVPFDPLKDFQFLSSEEMGEYECGEEYRRFLAAFREEYVYEMMRLGLEVTPYRTLEHIAGVHHIALTCGRALRRSGTAVDLALVSGSAAGHDIGKFGCHPGERVAYLHYYYTDLWFRRHRLTDIGHVAANHSVWDLEPEYLSAEALLLIYADFRVKQTHDPEGHEITHISSLAEAFDVILNKLDDVDGEKRRRYTRVYARLQDFEAYMIRRGVDVTMQGADTQPLPERAVALMEDAEVLESLTMQCVAHNMELMDRLTGQRSFASLLEQARGETNWRRLRAYLGVFESYSLYLHIPQKVQTLAFLYELLMHREGDIRRQAAALMGEIIAGFHAGYAKERPADSRPDLRTVTDLDQWRLYLEKIIYPDHKLMPQHRGWIRFTLKFCVKSLLSRCPGREERFLAPVLAYLRRPEQLDDQVALQLLDAAADLSVILTWWQLRDGVEDHGFFGGLKYRLAALLLRRSYRKAARLRPDFDRLVQGCLGELTALEQENCPSIDRPADTFARLLAGAAEEEPDPVRRRVLAQLLYHLGRWIYLTDAADDLAKDQRSGSYNPLPLRFSVQEGKLTEESRQELAQTMDRSVERMAAAFELLECGVWQPIIESVVYAGLYQVGNAVLNGTFHQRPRREKYPERKAGHGDA